jgi:hypothetical protein
MQLTPKRVQRILDRWSEVTAAGREMQFTGYLVIGVVGTVGTAIAEDWWFVAACIGFSLVILRLLWELPDSAVRRWLDALNRRRG